MNTAQYASAGGGVSVNQSGLVSTCLAVDLVRAVVLAVVEEVAAQVGTDATAIATEELVLLTGGHGWGGLCEKHTRTHAYTHTVSFHNFPESHSGKLRSGQVK